MARALGAPVPSHGWAPHYNITPGRPIAGALAGALDYAWWGFKPRWADHNAPAPINARAETVATSRYFRGAFEHRRCLIPANGWFEWQETSAGKQPWYVTVPDAPFIAYAAIWAESDQETGRCCAIITEPARGAARSIHPRMPLVLAPDCWHAWLDAGLTRRHEIRAAVHRLDPGQLRAWPISRRVNRPAEDDEALIQRAD